MIYVHGIWIPTEPFSTPGYFFVWAETAVQQYQAKERKSAQDHKSPLHPFVCNSFSLKSILFQSNRAQGLDSVSFQLRRKTIELELPSKGGEPIASALSLRDTLEQPGQPGDYEFSRYRVEGIAVPGSLLFDMVLPILHTDDEEVTLSVRPLYFTKRVKVFVIRKKFRPACRMQRIS